MRYNQHIHRTNKNAGFDGMVKNGGSGIWN